MTIPRGRCRCGAAPLLALSLAVSTGAPALAQVARSTVLRAEVSVPAANDEWTASGITVAVNDLVLVRATGRVRLGRLAGEVGPAGVLGSGHGPGLLLGKIGSASMFPVGVQTFVVATQAGPLQFKVRDSRYDDNDGSFSVDVIVVPASLIPPHRSKD